METITTYQIGEKYQRLDKEIKSLIVKRLEKLIDNEHRTVQLIGPDYFAYSFNFDELTPDRVAEFREGFNE